MTLDALQGSVERPRDEQLERLSIGEPDANIFLCPRCARPLAAGVSRCAGCGSRLVDGVQLKKVGRFVGAGLMVGILLGGGGVGAAMFIGQPAIATVSRPGTAVTPSAGPIGSAAPGPVAVDVPPAALSALRQSTLINQRLLADAMQLERILKRKSPSAVDIAPVLRGLASTAAFGDGLAPRVRTWDAGAAVAKSLASFYAAVARTADEGLEASLTNDRAYADAGRRMRTVLDRLTDLDAASRGLAATAGVELPPLVPAR
jgi:hypothetical protein